MGINVWLRQGGYLFLAQSAEVARAAGARARRCTTSTACPRRSSRPDAARDVVPELTHEGVQLCAYNPEDGVIFPWPFLWGYAQSAQKRGVRVETFTDVTGLRASPAGACAR